MPGTLAFPRRAACVCKVSVFKPIKKINCCSSAKGPPPLPPASVSLDSSSTVCIIYEQRVHFKHTEQVFFSYLGCSYIFKLESAWLCVQMFIERGVRASKNDAFLPNEDSFPPSIATSSRVESQGLLLCLPLLSALYANTHFSINLVVHSEPFDITLALCKVIYPEFIWPRRSPRGMTPLITNLESVFAASEETDEVSGSKLTVSLNLEKVPVLS